jgi:hypothetical protein
MLCSAMKFFLRASQAIGANKEEIKMLIASKRQR